MADAGAGAVAKSNPTVLIIGLVLAIVAVFFIGNVAM